MSKPSVELDFFGMEKESSCKSQFQKFLDRRRSFRGLQSAISKMNPEVIKSVIASGLTNPLSQDQIDSNKSSSVPSSPKEPQSLFPALPLAPDARAASENGPETAPLTIFYNGTVSVFNVPRDKVERILKHAVEGVSKNFKSIDSKVRTPTSDQQQLLETLEGDLPIARRKSLQRFLEKRKERGKEWNQPTQSCSGRAQPFLGIKYPAGRPIAWVVVKKTLSRIKKSVYLF